MWLTLIWVLCATPQIESTEAMLIRARITRDPEVLAPHRFTREGCSDLLLQEYLLTLGQIGRLDHADAVRAFFDYAPLRDTALFAYGELDGAPIAALTALVGTVSGPGLQLLFEAMAKLATPKDVDAVVAAWRGLAPEDRAAVVSFLWRTPHDALTAEALKVLDGPVTGAQGGYVYYLQRARVAVPAALKKKLLKDYAAYTELPALVARLKPTDGASTADALLPLVADDDWRMRVNALNALAVEDPMLVVKAAVPRLTDPNPNVVRTALRVLLGLDWDTVDASLSTVAEGFSPSQLQTMVAEVPDERLAAFLPLVETWPASEDPWQRLQAVTLLGRRPGEDTVAMLRKTLAEGTPTAKALALRALAARGDVPDRADLARAALASDDVYLKAAAVALADPALLPELEAEAAKTFAEVEYHYALMDRLAEWGDAAVTDRVLRALLGHPDDLVRLKAYNSLPEADRGSRDAVLKGPRTHAPPPEVAADAVALMRDTTERHWVLTTTKGRVDIALAGTYAPITVASIRRLTEAGYFDNMAWHRVVPNFVVQGGDPRGDGAGGPGYAIPCEVNMLRFARGTVGMALAGKDTGGSQFFICHSAQPHLDGGYTIFGQVADGMAVVDRLEEGDRILKAEIR